MMDLFVSRVVYQTVSRLIGRLTNILVGWLAGWLGERTVRRFSGRMRACQNTHTCVLCTWTLVYLHDASPVFWCIYCISVLKWAWRSQVVPRPCAISLKIWLCKMISQSTNLSNPTTYQITNKLTNQSMNHHSVSVQSTQ